MTWESQVSLAVVVDQTFISKGMDLCTHLFIDHYCLLFVCVLNFRGLSQAKLLKFPDLHIYSERDITHAAQALV